MHSFATCPFRSNTWIFPDKYKDKKFLECYDPEYISFSYSKSLELIRKIALKINQILPEKGAKIAVMGKNSPEWVIAYLAISYAGKIIVPLDNQLKEDDFIDTQSMI